MMIDIPIFLCYIFIFQKYTIYLYPKSKRSNEMFKCDIWSLSFIVQQKYIKRTTKLNKKFKKGKPLTIEHAPSRENISLIQ